ncbi:MAG: dihydrofolate reductase [Planctomycetota bacterium]
MRLSIIVAASENGVIGRGGDLPWRLSSDLRRFKRLTMGHCLIMGRKTYESIGRPLPGRVSIVLSRADSRQPTADGLLYARSLDEALSLASTTAMSHDAMSPDAMSQDGAFVTGGGEVYRLALPHADRVYLTRVHATVDGDATFPTLDASQWRLTEAERHAADEKNEHAFSFEVWDREDG